MVPHVVKTLEPAELNKLVPFELTGVAVALTLAGADPTDRLGDTLAAGRVLAEEEREGVMMEPDGAWLPLRLALANALTACDADGEADGVELDDAENDAGDVTETAVLGVDVDEVVPPAADGDGDEDIGRVCDDETDIDNEDVSLAPKEETRALVLGEPGEDEADTLTVGLVVRDGLTSAALGLTLVADEAEADKSLLDCEGEGDVDSEAVVVPELLIITGDCDMLLETDDEGGEEGVGEGDPVLAADCDDEGDSVTDSVEVTDWQHDNCVVARRNMANTSRGMSLAGGG